MRNPKGSLSMLIARSNRLIGSVAIALFAAVLPAPDAGALVPSSPSFKVFGDGLNIGAGTSSSASFSLMACLQPASEAAGASTSASFRVETGCVSSVMAGLPVDDDDGDGVDNAGEDNGPNNGDGDGSGTADSMEGNTATVPAASGEGQLTVSVPPNGPCGQLLDVMAVDPATLGTDDGFEYPYGMISFRIENCAGPVPVTVFFHGTPQPIADYRKHGLMAPAFAPPEDFYSLPGVALGWTTVGGVLVQTASFTLTDNQLGDGDPTVLAMADPSGPATAEPAAPAPAASPTAVAVMIAVLTAIALAGFRRRYR